MPLLFRHSPQEVKSLMDPRDVLLAFLDDVCVISQDPNRVRQALDLLDDKLATQAGIRLHTGKTRVWNRASVCPARMAELGPEVWNPTGIKIPVGPTAFVQEVVNKKKVEAGSAVVERHLFSPRLASSMADALAEDHARSHDDGMERVMRMVGISGEQQEVAAALNILLGLMGRRVTDGDSLKWPTESTSWQTRNQRVVWENCVALRINWTDMGSLVGQIGSH